MSQYYKKLAKVAKEKNWSHRKLGEFIKKNKGKPPSIALKNLEKES